MEGDEAPLDDKAKRMRDLLSSFYAIDSSSSHSTATLNHHALPFNASARYATLDTINTASFDADRYMNLLVQKSNLDALLQRHFEMAAEIKNLDTDLQMLVYENYNKFISATRDAQKRMKGNIVGMEANMEQLLEKILCVQSRSDGVNTSLHGKRDHIEKMHRTRNLLRKVQFIYDLPTRLGKCIKAEAYADAVRLYTGAMPIFKAYGDSSFKDCKRASEQEVSVIIKTLQRKVLADSESVQARAEAVMLLNQLNFPVDNLKDKVLKKLEQVLGDMNLESGEVAQLLDNFDESSKKEIVPELSPENSQTVSTREFVEAARAYKVIFPDSREQLIRLMKDLIMKHFEVTQRHIDQQISSTDLLEMLRSIWNNVLVMDEILPEAAFPELSLKGARVAVEHFVTISFSRLLLNITDPLTKLQRRQEGLGEEYSFQGVLEASKKSVIQDSMSVLLDFRQLLEENLGLLLNLNKLIIEWVHRGFQDLFKKLDDQFRSLSGLNTLAGGVTEGSQSEKVLPGIVLVMSELSIFIEQIAIPRITEEMAVSFSESGARGYNSGPVFVSEEICHTFHSASEKFLHLYIKMRMKKISAILRKRFTAPNWLKHKEPREVHMFVDILLQELKVIGNNVKQILPQGPHVKHRHTDSNGSGSSSLSNSFNNDKLSKFNMHRTRNQLLETHLINLFKQKLKIFTKVEHTQESVYSTIVKLCLKSLHELVRLQTFNRSGFQQIQLDMQFLRSMLKETAEDEAAVNFLLDEVIVAAGTRCLDPILLDSPVLDKLIQTKLAKNSEEIQVSP
nr:PREDICTED: vacuolar protein sorting-associated protein 51 homolog [Daucus carota subsp. sativus]